jgi:1-acyl-sn-glycerol-3-phosphate acyltransferase
VRGIDGFKATDADGMHRLPSRASARYYGLIGKLGAALHVRVDGIEHLPAGRALIVANHAFGWDVAFPMAAVARGTGRPVWALGEHLWWRVPGLRRVAAGVGVVDGRPQNAERLLADDQIVFVLPGGLREAVKPHELRYRLLWGRRYGFVRVAARTAAPILPLACLGADEWFDFVGDAYARGRRWHLRIPIPRPSHLLAIPHQAPLHYVIGEPIDTVGVDPEDPRAVRRIRREVEGALHEIIEEELARRAGLPYP